MRSASEECAGDRFAVLLHFKVGIAEGTIAVVNMEHPITSEACLGGGLRRKLKDWAAEYDDQAAENEPLQILVFTDFHK